MSISKPNLREVSSNAAPASEHVNTAHVFQAGKKMNVITRLEGFAGEDVTFPVPYKITGRETYGMRQVKGKWQLWEVTVIPNQPEATYVWVREAPRVK